MREDRASIDRVQVVELNAIADFALKLRKHVTIDALFITGGCLRRTQSKDVDVLLKCVVSGAIIDQIFTDLGWSYTVYKQYAPADSGKDMIIKASTNNPACRPFDFMFVSTYMQCSVVEFMDKYYPYNVQRVAWDTFTGSLQYGRYSTNTEFLILGPGHYNTDSLVPKVIPWDLAADYISKYRVYYPHRQLLIEAPDGDFKNE